MLDKGYRDSGKPVAEVGRELGANYIVEGSVRRSVDRVRICAQLVDARHQTQLWAAPYDRTLGDVLAVQCDVGQEITDEIGLALGLTTEGRGGPGRIPQEEPEAPSASDRTSVFLSWEARPQRRGKAPVVAMRVLPECQPFDSPDSVALAQDQPFDSPDSVALAQDQPFDSPRSRGARSGQARVPHLPDAADGGGE